MIIKYMTHDYKYYNVYIIYVIIHKNDKRRKNRRLAICGSSNDRLSPYVGRRQSIKELTE